MTELARVYADKDGLDGQFSAEMPAALAGKIEPEAWAKAIAEVRVAQAELRKLLCSCWARTCLCLTCAVYLVCILPKIQPKNEEIKRRVEAAFEGSPIRVVYYEQRKRAPASMAFYQR